MPDEIPGKMATRIPQRSPAFDFLAGGGDMGTLIRAADWSTTPVGPPESWPPSLRTAIGMVLGSRFPACLVWGPGLITLYNDAFRPILGTKPEALGRSFSDVWAEAWHEIGPIAERAMAGDATFIEDFPLVIERNGYPEQAFFTFCYSPVRDETGAVAGFLDTVVETTATVLAKRRAALLAALDERLRDATGAGELIDAASTLLGEHLGADAVGYVEVEAAVSEPMAVPGIGGGWRVDGDQERLSADAEAFLAEYRGGRLPGTLDLGADIVSPLQTAGRTTALLFVRADAPRRWTPDDRALIADAAERVRAMVDRLQAQAALRASEEFNRRILQASADCIKVLSLDGQLEFMSEGGMCVMEVEDFGAVAGACWPEFWPDRERAKIDEAMAAARSGLAGRFQGFATTMKGSPRWWDVAVTPINGDHGRPEKLLSVSRDITATKLAEERLRVLNETLESEVIARTAERDRMWETSPDLMLVIDFEGMFRRVNPAWTRLLGYPPEELVGRHVNDFVLPEHHEETIRAYEFAAAGGQPRLENRYRHKDGSERWIAWVAAPAGEATYATGRDITADKQRQAELAAAQEALRQSQKMEAMGSLTGGVAHDFNNLLTPIVGGLDMLARKGLGGEREQRLIAGALQSAERAKTLVQRLLAFARRQPLQATAVDIGALVENMAELISSTTGPQIRVAVEIARDLPAAFADQNQVEMALLNLAVNARDAMPDGGTLRISAEGCGVESPAPDLQCGAYVRLSVADTGTGMDDATLSRAIEPFFSTKGIGQGTGLGLSMVHGLASQLGGALRIQSRRGIGTNIELWLPVSSAPAAPLDGSADAQPPVDVAGVALLVDDEELVRMSTAAMLHELGYEVVEADSSERAMELVRSGLRPELLVTDHLMPGMAGTDLARTLLAGRSDLQVLVVSGYAEDDGIAPDLPRLTKPFRKDELAAKLFSL